MSARELWTQRDQFTHQQLPMNDDQVIKFRHAARLRNHPYSKHSKAPEERRPPDVQIQVGDLVYLHGDRSKLKARDRYLVSAIDGDWCEIRKFSGSQLRAFAYRVNITSATVYLMGHQSSRTTPAHLRMPVAQRQTLSSWGLWV